jgi:hypothetical protein
MYGQAFMMFFEQGHVPLVKDFSQRYELDAAVPRLYVKINDIATSVGETEKSLIHFDFDFVAVGIADKRRKSFTGSAVVDFGLGWVQTFALERGNHVVNTGSGGAQTKMFFAQISGRRRVRGSSFEQIQQRISRPQRDDVISGFGLAFTLHGETQALGVKPPHGDKVSGHQRNVVKACVGKH